MEETKPQKPYAWLVGFDESKQRIVNIPLFWKTSGKTGNTFLKASKLEFAIPAGTILHIFVSERSNAQTTLDFT
jgi:hypothetical protein